MSGEINDSPQRQAIDISKRRISIQMPSLIGDYFTTDIQIMENIEAGGVVIHCDKYRKVKCGRGSRKISQENDMITIPKEIIVAFLEAIYELVPYTKPKISNQ